MSLRALNCAEELRRLGVRREPAGHYPDFHKLDSRTVAELVNLASRAGYREPKNANGSRARYCYAALCRYAVRERNGRN